MLENKKVGSNTILHLEKNSKKVISKYFEFFKKNFFKKKLSLKSSFIFQSDICEFNLYKHNKEILFFLKFLSCTKFTKKKVLYKNRNNNSFLVTIFLILKNFIRANHLFFSFFAYSFFLKLKKKNKLNNKFDYLFINYLDHPEAIKKESRYWGNITNIIKDKKICWIHHTYINKNNISNFKNYKNYDYLKNFSKKNENHFFLEELISLKSFITVFIKYCYFFISNIYTYIYFLTVDKSIDKEYFVLSHNKIFLDSLFGKSLMRSIIFYENFNYIFKKKYIFKKIFYLKECLNWEKILSKVLVENNFKMQNVYGFIHTPIRYWDLKFISLQNKFEQSLKENILVLSNSCKKKLLLKRPLNKNIQIVESLRFKKISTNSKINKTKRKDILLLGSYNQVSTRKMINETIKYLKKYKIKDKIHIKLHPSDNYCIHSNFIKFEKNDIQNLLRLNKFKKIIVEQDSSISLQLLVDKINFVIFQNNNNLNSSFLRNNKKIKFVSNYKQINKALNSKLSKIDIKDIYINPKKLNLWKKQLIIEK